MVFSDFTARSRTQGCFRFEHEYVKSQTYWSSSTVLEQDHFYSDFLLSQTTVSTNFNHLEDEARHLVDRREYSCLWRAVLVTFNYHRCSTERRFFLNYACARLCSRVRCKQEFSAASVRLNLPGWRWTRIKQLVLARSSSSSHSEVCKALGGSSGVGPQHNFCLRQLASARLPKTDWRTRARLLSRMLCTCKFSSVHFTYPCGRGNSIINDALRRCAVC